MLMTDETNQSPEVLLARFLRERTVLAAFDAATPEQRKQYRRKLDELDGFTSSGCACTDAVNVFCANASLRRMGLGATEAARAALDQPCQCECHSLRAAGVEHHAHALEAIRTGLRGLLGRYFLLEETDRKTVAFRVGVKQAIECLMQQLWEARVLLRPAEAELAADGAERERRPRAPGDSGIIHDAIDRATPDELREYAARIASRLGSCAMPGGAA